MGFDGTLDLERWLRQQRGEIHDIFERAAEELQSSGIRLLIGSMPPVLEDQDGCTSIKIAPLRFGDSNRNEALSLSLAATTRRGPPRYLVVLEVSGVLVIQALQKLATEHQDIWEKTYLKNGFWMSDSSNALALNTLSQITQSGSSGYHITVVFLHSDMSQTIRLGVMVMGILYRSILDEIAEASKMGRLFTQLINSLGNNIPRFQRNARP